MGLGKIGEGFSIKMNGPKDSSHSGLHLWSPDSPYLYDLDVTLSHSSDSQVRQCRL